MSEIFLTLLILLFVLLALLFLTLLVISRLRKIQRAKKKEVYDSVIETILFSVMFDSKSFEAIALEKEYVLNIRDSFFVALLIDAVIKLHKNYSGAYAKSLETFYHESKLVDESCKKLKKGKWSVKCEAIQELAEMNELLAFSLIVKYVDDKNLILRQEAIVAIVKLKGVEGLSFLINYKEQLNEWLQINLIAIIKNNYPYTDSPFYDSFISSENNSVSLFGKRLKAFYEQNGEAFFESGSVVPISYAHVSTLSDKVDKAKQSVFASFKQKSQQAFTLTFSRISVVFILVLLSFLASHIFEISENKALLTPTIIGYSLLNDLYTSLLIAFLISPILLILGFIGKRTAASISWIVCLGLIVIHLALSVYFLKAKVPLGSDLFGYSMDDILFTAKAAGGFSYSLLTSLCICLFLVGFIAYNVNKLAKVISKMIGLISISVVLVFVTCFFLKKERIDAIDEYANYVTTNKSAFFFGNIMEKYNQSNEFDFVDDKQYYLANSSSFEENTIDPTLPFFKHNSQRNTLAPFFNDLSVTDKPNIVFILLEGMGSDFLGATAKLGNFNPFLDSLSQKSLFWENALSSGGRTFAALPSIFGSLPFMKQGYLEEGINAPKANSFFNIMNCNGYSSQYFCGYKPAFDKMDIFLKQQHVEVKLDITKFGPQYKQLPSSNDFSWGYGDKDLFDNYFRTIKIAKPSVSVFFTVANHTPYLIPNQEFYIQKAKERLQQLKLPQEKKEFLGSYLKELSCIVYADDALKFFFDEFAKRDEFKNTIFVITGDHRAPEIPVSFQIDRFRVPLVIYSPLLKKAAHFKSIVTHFDITPSLLALLSKTIKQPQANSWIGTLLDTSTTFMSSRQVGLMRNKNEFVDYISNEYLLSDNNLYKINDEMGLETVTNESKIAQIKQQFEVFKQKNQQVFSTRKLIPDSVLSCETYTMLTNAEPFIGNHSASETHALTAVSAAPPVINAALTSPPPALSSPINKIDAEKAKTENALKTLEKNNLPTNSVSTKSTIRSQSKGNFSAENGSAIGKGFYVIVGTFGNKTNAKKQLTTKVSKKYANSILIQNKTTKNYNVVAMKLDTQDAVDKTNYKKEFPDAWVLKLE